MNIDQHELFILSRILLDIPSIGPHKVLRLFSIINKFGSLNGLTINNIAKLEGFSKQIASRIIRTLESPDSLREKYLNELEDLEKKGISFTTFWSENYPEQLKNIFTPPVILYYIGNFELCQTDSVAIVGTRRPTRYGKKMAETLSAELTAQGITIVSGLARGIDSVAHRACLKNNGKTISVIGSGVDVIYPPENKELFEQIAEGGLIISEYPPGTKPDAQNFPRRNRIISGISLGTVIVETRIQGGAMHTAKYALDQNREVFAVPGNIDSPTSRGTNLLIKNNEAKLVQNAEDILVELNLKMLPDSHPINKNELQLNLFEEKIFDILESEPMHIDIISEKAGMSTADCLVHLLGLEFKGAVRQYPGKLFAKL